MNSMKRVGFKPMDFSARELSEVRSKGRMLVLMAETTAKCLLNCSYCYRKEDDKGRTQKDRELDLDERLNLIQDAARLGAKAYHIVGAGEPLTDPIFAKQLGEARRFGMDVMVPTDGIMLQSERTLDMLEASGASILLKLNSFSDNVERELVRREGYADMRNWVLKKLLDRKSFNKEEIGKSGAITTRLAISSMITRLNQHELLDILRFCRENNIAPFMTTFIPMGRTAREIGLTPAKEELEGLFRQAKEQDTRMGIDGGNANIYLGGMECFQRGLGPYITITGEAKVCVGEKKAVGRIQEESLDSIWTRVRKKTSRFLSRDARRICPPRENALHQASL